MTSQMQMRIVYQRPDGHREPHLVENLRVDDIDENTIHFEWTISGNVTVVKGNISFMVCAKLSDSEGIREREWHTRLNRDLVVDEGMECSGEEIVEQNPDIIEAILIQLDDLKNTGGVSDEQVANAVAAYLEEHPIDSGVDELEVRNIVAAYLEENPPDGGAITEEQIETAVANYMFQHPVEGEPGGHYIPVVTQPTDNTMQVSFTPSKADMPTVESVTVNLPVGEGSGQNLELDPTLTQSGKAADAKAVSDALAKVGNPTDEQVGNAVGNWLEAHPEATTVVADGSIAAAKTTFIEPVADNLIDMSKVVKGYQGANGVPAGGSLPNTTTGCTTDYIEVEAGSTYNSVGNHGTSGIWASWYYDMNKNPVSIVEGNPFTVPDGVRYVRLTFVNNADISTLQLGLYKGINPMVYTQGVQRYGLDELLTASVKTVHDKNSVFKVTDKNLYKLAAEGSMNSTTGIFTLSGGSLNISDYIEVTPGIYYISNCFAAPNYSAVYDKNHEYISTFSDAIEWGSFVTHDSGTYKVFKVTNPDVRYIVNGSSKTLDTPIKTPFIVRGNAMPESLDGIDVSTESVAFVEAAKKLLGITGNDLAGMTWAVLGDSITAAPGLTRSYHGIIAEKLGLTAINYGYTGSWISHTDAMPEGNEMCVRYATMTEDADIITCFGGINDINGNAPIGEMGNTESGTFYGAMDILIRGLLYRYPGKRIGFITPLRYGDGAKAKSYIEAIHAVCEKYAVPVLDLYREGMISTATQELSTIYFKDGLHPNELGHDVIARKVEAFLRGL